MRTRTISAAVAALALALTAGCGSSADVADGGDGGAGATPSTSSQGGSSDEGATELTSANFADTLGGAQTDARSAHMTISMEAAGQKIDAEADVITDSDPSKTAMRMTMDASGQSIEMTLVDGALYMKAPGMPEGKWMKLSLDAAAGAAGESFGQLRDSMDPTKSIENLKDALKSVTATGQTETIDGVEASRYDVVVDTSKIAGMEAAAAAQLPAEITYEYWVGPDDLPRKVVMDVAQIPMEMTFTKWGEDVEITAPPAGQVVDGSSMMGG
ncbi:MULTISPECIES: DUF6612 family protein [Mumia]|uniref:DUF6612 family protein n=1 Tax=Mumia TaxID=1546255 RepID=UPI0014244DFE|nr:MULTISPECIES: DUF6612 family protein [unclassified Mumia]QMW65797.1 hypothetical protein H4N58_16730 [Mumia sp. ZJ1417]